MIAALPTRFPRLSALIFGTASATGFAPLGLWPVTLIALVMLLHLVATAPTTKRALLLGWLFGLGHFTLSLHWIATAFTYQAAMPPILGWVAVPLVSLYLALYPACACAAAWWVWKRVDTHGRALPFTLLFAAAWIISEWLRSWVFTGFAWNPLAAVWLKDFSGPPLIRIIGTYGASGLLVLTIGLMRSYWLWLKTERSGFANRDWLLRTVIWSFSLSIFFVPLNLLDDWYVTDAGYGTPATQVTIVQPNIDQGDKWDLAQRFDNFHRLARLSTPRTPVTPRLLLWPEAAVPDYLEDSAPPDWTIEDPVAVRARLAALLGPDDLLLTGAVRLETNAARSEVEGARNAVFTLDAAGRLGPRYDKAHLVPYGEYLPMRTILEPLGLSRLAPGAVDFWSGLGPRSIDLGRFGKVGIQICYEIIFSGQVVDRDNRPAFIFNPSNDAWFGAWGPPQHLAQARLRAIEEGLPVVRATPTGISAIIDADGRIVEGIPMHRAGRIDAALPPPHAPTLFAKYGNVLPLAFAFFLGLLGVVIGRRRR